jgi:hypothetical protein
LAKIFPQKQGNIMRQKYFKSGGKRKTAALVIVFFFFLSSSFLNRTLVFFSAIAVRSFHIPK